MTPLPQIGKVKRMDVYVVDKHFTGTYIDQSEKNLKQSCFARSCPTDDSHFL